MSKIECARQLHVIYLKQQALRYSGNKQTRYYKAGCSCIAQLIEREDEGNRVKDCISKLILQNKSHTICKHCRGRKGEPGSVREMG